MAYQKKVTTSYGGRLKNSLGGIKTGAILFAIGTILLFLNEGNFVKTKKSIGEANKSLIQVSDVSTLDQSLNGKLIHAYAFADTQDILNDKLFGVSEKAIGLNRKVEYYQYRENTSKQTQDKMGGSQETTTTYTYSQEWSSNPIDSSKFEDPDYRSSNFTLMQIDAGAVYAENVSFGAYKLPQFIISSISGSSPASVDLGATELAQFEAQMTRSMASAGKKQDGQTVKVSGNVVYFGKSSSSPSIGDVRVTITKIAPADISIIAKVVGNTFDRFIASNGREISMVSMGIVGADTMIARAQSANKAVTWLLRLLGVILIVTGLKSLFEILPSLFKVLPFLGKIIGAGVGLVCTIGGGAWSLVIIAIAWLFYRPLIAIPMLAAAVGGIVFLSKRNKNNKSGEQPAAEGAQPSSANNAPVSDSAGGWDCICGCKENKGKFCAECGKPKPE